IGSATLFHDRPAFVQRAVPARLEWHASWFLASGARSVSLRSGAATHFATELSLTSVPVPHAAAWDKPRSVHFGPRSGTLGAPLVLAHSLGTRTGAGSKQGRLRTCLSRVPRLWRRPSWLP